MAQAYVPIQTVTVGSGGAASIEFTNIPQTYTDLVIVLSLRADAGTSFNDTRMTINSSTSGYTSRLLYGTGSGTGSANNNTYQYAYWVGSATTPSYTASTFSNIEVYIPNYSSSNNKSASVTAVAENNGTLGTQLMTALLWANSNAITSLSFTQDYGNYVQHSTATLYGIGGARASGGTITADARYTYHTFTSSGTFTALEKIKGAEVLLVAGGGSSGGYASGNNGLGLGGGGAGGLLLTSGQLLNAGNSYTVVVGAGGTGVGINTNGNNGSNSQFGSLTAAVGGGASRTPQLGGLSGGSGGGASGGGNGGTATAGQGNAGGANSGGAGAGSGGGGAGAVGVPNSGNSGGNGGDGAYTYSAWANATGTGVNGYYAGGGGGGSYDGFGTGGTGGRGGGGNGRGTSQSASNGTANTGGGAGGINNAVTSTNGGSGLVIIRYPN